MTPGLGEKRFQGDGVKQEDLGRDFPGAVLVFEGQQVQRTLVTTGAVLAGDIVPELVGADLGEEIAAMVEGLGIEELGLDGGVDALDIGVGIGTGGRVEAVPGSEALLDGEMKTLGPVVDSVAVELHAQVGGDDDLRGVDPVVPEVAQEALDGQCGVGLGEFVAVGQELGAAGEFADRVLEAGEFEGLHLGPVDGDVGEIFDIHLEAGERGVGGLDGAQVVLAPMFFAAGAGELVLAEDALGSVMTQGQIELGDEAAGAEARGLLAQGDDPGFESGVGLVWAGLGGAGVAFEAGVAESFEAVEPFADGIALAAEVAGGGRPGASPQA